MSGAERFGGDRPRNGEINDGDGDQEIDRRKVLTGAAALVALAGASAWAEDPDASALVIRSTPGLLGHSHELEIPLAFLAKPPERGLRLRSSRALYHVHEFVLSPEQLAAIAHGGAISLKASSHVFLIRKSARN